jgi:FkbM family methyltransferase
MKVIFFNVGAYIGEITEIFIKIFKELFIDYEIYQFEPTKELVKVLKEKFKTDPNVHTYPIALTDKEGEALLYKSERSDGHSLYSTKWNVDKNDFESVKCDKFSNWYNTNIKQKNNNEIYILKCNINGSELEFFKDLIESGLNKRMDIYCGKIYGNIQKSGILTLVEQENFKQYLIDNNIEEINLSSPFIYSNINLLKETIASKMITSIQPIITKPFITSKIITKEPSPRLRKERTNMKEIKEINR